MPSDVTRQNFMKIYMGKAPAVDDNHIIDDIAFKMNVVAKTADYTVKVGDSGTVFTNYGCTGTSVFTLPAVATADGCIFWFFSAAAGTFTVTAPATTLTTFNNAAATSVSWETGGEIIGNGFCIFSDGTLYYCMTMPAAVAATMTVA